MNVSVDDLTDLTVTPWLELVELEDPELFLSLVTLMAEVMLVSCLAPGQSPTGHRTWALVTGHQAAPGQGLTLVTEVPQPGTERVRAPRVWWM